MSCAQSSGVTMSCADSSHATPSHAQYRGQRQQAGGCHRAVAPRARAGAAAPPPPAAARPLPREPSGGSSASGRCVAQRPRRCRSRRLTEPLRQLALRYRRPPPIPGYYRGRAERRARRCGAGSGFYSASGAISPGTGQLQQEMALGGGLGVEQGKVDLHFIDPAPRGPELRPQSTAAAAKGGGAGGAEALAAGTGGWTRGLRSRRARA